ncbi:MAG: Lipoteichoic acid synthase 2 [Chlamydiae bacterium]|nr:Lipoteichoic acid synthase 2 [Chlamydiota bacterium]
MIILCGFLLFPLLARVIIFWSKRKEQRFWLIGWGIGFAQDLFIATLQLHLLCFFNGFHLTAYLPFFLLFSLFLGLIQVYHLIDALLLYVVNFRMKFTFFRYLLEFKDFKSSAIEYGIRPTVGFIVIFLGLFVAIMWSVRDLIVSQHFSYQVLLLSVLSFGVGLVGFWGRWKNRMYLYHNCLFKEGMDSFLSTFAPKYHAKTELEGGDSWILKAQCEEYRTISPHYPLLKMTTGFTGEKNFHIKINKEERPHVIIISLESFGAKHLGCLGNPYGASPQFDRLAKEGILFSNFHAAGIPTSRSLLGTLFGISPDLNPLSLQEVNPLYPLIGIQNILKTYGYRSIYHKGGSLVFLNASNYLKEHGFDELAGDEEMEAYFSHSHRTSWGVHDEQLFDYSLQRIKAQDQQGIPTFMTLCTISNHHPWQVPSEFEAPKFHIPKAPLSERYLQTFFYTDAMLGRFIDKLRQEGISRKSIIFVTADNGQPLGEHGENFMPLRYVYEENHHIPLLILADGRIDTPRVIHEPGSQIDLLPTIMDLLNLKGLNHSIGTSLVRQAPERHVFCVNPPILPYVSHQQGKYKYCLELESEQKELFDLEEDPEEKNNLLYNHPEIAKQLHSQLIDHFAALQRLYTENRITPSTNKSLVLIGERELSDEELYSRIEKLQELRSILILDCPNITDAGIINISKKVQQLEFLYLDKLPITDKSLEAFQGKTVQLKELTLSHCLSISSESVVKLLSDAPELLELTLTGSLQLGDDVLSTLAKKCPKINNLELPECFSLTDEGFRALATSLPQLRRLNLQNLTQITDDTLEILSHGKYDLHALHLLECSAISEEGILQIIEANPNLRRLSFSATHVSDLGIQKIVNHCPNLMKLCIYDCQQFAEEGFRAIAKKCRHLIMLELAGCPHLTDDFFRILSDKPIDHLLIAAAPQITDEALSYIKTISTLRDLFMTYCPQVHPEKVWEVGEEMHRTGLLHEITFNQTKKVYTYSPKFSPLIAASP